MTDSNGSEATSYVHPRDELVSVMLRMYSRHLTTSSGGNASIRDVDGAVWMTPKGNDKGALTRDEIAYRTTEKDGWQGKYPPSSEWPFHTRIYNCRDDVGAVLHAHSQTLVAFSVANKLPNTRALSQAAFLCGSVGLAPYAMPGSDALADSIESAILDHDCVIMENHGVLVVAETMAEAYQKFEALEFCARAEIRAKVLGGTKYLLTAEDTAAQAQITAQQSRLLHHFIDSKTDKRPPVSPQECELRATLVKFIRRAYDQGLIHSTSGAMSAKLTQTSFLITPSGVDRHLVRPQDLILVHFRSLAHAKDGREACVFAANADLMPSRAWVVHNAVYHAFPDTHAIMHAHPFHITSFCMTSVQFPSNVIPESYIVLQNVARVPYRTSLEEDKVVEALQKDNANVLLVDNDGVMVKGKSLEQVFDRMEVLEATANVVLECMPLGDLNLMSEKQMDEIDDKWFGGKNKRKRNGSHSPLPESSRRRQQQSEPEYASAAQGYGMW